jgi:hypothetical protein
MSGSNQFNDRGGTARAATGDGNPAHPHPVRILRSRHWQAVITHASMDRACLRPHGTSFAIRRRIEIKRRSFLAADRR